MTMKSLEVGDKSRRRKQQQGMRACGKRMKSNLFPKRNRLLSFCKTKNQKWHGSSVTGSGTPCSGALSSCSWCIVAGGRYLVGPNK